MPKKGVSQNFQVTFRSTFGVDEPSGVNSQRSHRHFLTEGSAVKRRWMTRRWGIFPKKIPFYANHHAILVPIETDKAISTPQVNPS